MDSASHQFEFNAFLALERMAKQPEIRSRMAMKNVRPGVEQIGRDLVKLVGEAVERSLLRNFERVSEIQCG